MLKRGNAEEKKSVKISRKNNGRALLGLASAQYTDYIEKDFQRQNACLMYLKLVAELSK